MERLRSHPALFCTRSRRALTLLAVAALLCLAACSSTPAQSTPAPTEAAPPLPNQSKTTLAASAREQSPTAPAVKTATPPVQSTTVPTVTPTDTLTPTPAPSGPQSYPPGVNPLTGIVVKDPSTLRLPPALISISNSPVTTRPQSGLSFSPVVYEMYIGEGATRFLAVFYGDYPASPGAEGAENEGEIGPIRSGRLPYEKLRQMYYGFLLFAGASQRVLPGLEEYTTVLNDDPEDINGASVTSAEVRSMAGERLGQLGEPRFFGTLFDPLPPEGGKPAPSAWVDFHYFAQVFWRYDSGDGSYHRYQDTGESTPLEEATDRLSGEALSVENLVILFTNYHRFDDLLFNIDLMYIHRYPALIFRDGKMYEAFWTTRNEEYEFSTGRIRPIRYIYYDGAPFPMKPGLTWVEIIHLYSPYYETYDTTDYHILSSARVAGSGRWAVLNILPAYEPTQNAAKYCCP